MGIGNIKFGILLFLVSLFQGLLWALIIPPWQAPDEPVHFGYIQHLAEHGNWLPPGRTTRISAELQSSLRLLKSENIKYNNLSTFAFTPEEAESVLEDLNAMTLQDRVEPGKVNNHAGHYPPLYYKIGTMGYLAFYDSNILGRLLGTRLVSIVLTSLTVLVMFFASRLFFEDDPLCSRTAAALLLFHPMHAFIGSNVILDTLLILISTVMILLCLQMIRYRPTWKIQAGLCACLALGLLTKPTFIAIIPLWFLALWISCLRDGPGYRKNLAHVIFTVGILLAAGFAYLNFGDNYLRLWMNSMQAGGEDGSKSLLSYLAITIINAVRPWSLMAKRFLTSYWANFGWLDTYFPFVLYLAAFLVTVTAGISVILRIWKTPTAWYGGRSGLLAFGLLGSFIFTIGMVIMGYTIAHQAWGSGNLQGRYFFPTLSLHMMLLTAGLLLPLKSEGQRRRMAFALVGAMLLFHIASYTLVIERFYL